MAKSPRDVRLAKPGVFLVSLVPFGWLVFGLFQGELGTNPVETITHETGDWALRFLLLTLAVTPLRELMGWQRLMLFRRMLGLFAYFYAVLHFSTWMVFDHFFDGAAMLEDVLERPYITFGMSAFVLLLPLAITSTNGWVRRLGRRWKQLHRLVYPAAIIAVLHFLWLVKADLREPLIYAAILTVLLGWRLLPQDTRRRIGRRPRRATVRPAGVSPVVSTEPARSR
jgi:sulfoxide reductase heme-binding subunit YedZ